MLFIHEYPDWTQFRYNSKMVMMALGETRLMQGRLLGSMEALSADFRKSANSAVIKKEFESSFEIDGRNHELQQHSTATLIQDYIRLLDNFSTPLTEERLFKLQHHISQLPLKKWRQDPMLISANNKEGFYKTLSPERIPREMQQFMEWYNDSSKDQVLVAALAHFRFVTIHPFPKGNGRLARLISDVALARSEKSVARYYSMSEAILNEKEQYFEILKRAQSGDGDLTEWLLWFTKIMRKALNQSLQVHQKILQRAQFWNANSHLIFNDRQRLMLIQLLDGFEEKLNTRSWAKINKCSTDTALRDIQDLLKKNILEKDAAKGRSTSYQIKRG